VKSASTSEQVVNAYVPKSISAEKWRKMDAFVRSVVLRAFDESPYPRVTRGRISMVARFVSWAIDEGIPLEVEEIFHPATVNRYAQTQVRWADTTKASNRATLSTVSRRITQAAPWEPHREVIHTSQLWVPYTDAEMRWLTDCAAQQKTKTRVGVLTAMLALGFGAGLRTSEMLAVTGADVRRRRGHVLVIVSGRRARTVPVFDQYAESVVDLARGRRGDALIGRNNARPTYLSYTVARCSIPAVLQPFSVTRLRATWEIKMLQAVPLPLFLRLSGHSSASALVWDGLQTRRPPDKPWTARQVDVIAGGLPL
jgi:integrase